MPFLVRKLDENEVSKQSLSSLQLQTLELFITFLCIPANLLFHLVFSRIEFDQMFTSSL